MRALIVEDDRSWQEILAEILTDSGMEVDVVNNVDQALTALRARSHRIAVVDLSLGGSDHHNQDGLHVLQVLRQVDPGCVGILLTGFATVELAVSALSEHGAFTCLRKEAFQRSEFRKIVDRALSANSVQGSRVYTGGDTSIESPPGSVSALDREPNKIRGLVLVVEDDGGWRNILSELLIESGFQVRLCGSYGEALGCLRRERYDLAVIDLSLANSVNAFASSWIGYSSSRSPDGYRLLASTRAGTVPTIVVSGLSDPGDIELAYSKHGIFAYLQKQVFERQVFIQTAVDAFTAGKNNRALDNLTGREKEVLELLARGLTNKEIAETLVISTNTVKRHLKGIFDKLAIHTRSAAAAKAVGVGVSNERPDNDDPDSEFPLGEIA